MLSFWINIIRRAWKSAEKEIGIKGLFIDLLIALVALCIYWLAKGRPPINELGEGGIIAIYVYFGVIVIASIFYIFREPSVVDKEQKVKIRRLEKKINNKTIKTRKIKLAT